MDIQVHTWSAFVHVSHTCTMYMHNVLDCVHMYILWLLLVPSSLVPGPVKSFIATTVSSNVILLSWTPPLSPNGRIKGYNLIYSASLPSGAVQNGSVLIRSSSTGALTVSDLEEDVLYQFTLRAETNGEGRGGEDNHDQTRRR